MRWPCFLLIPIAALVLAGAGRADPAPSHPWDQAQSLYEATMVDFKASGFSGIAQHASDMEAALAAAGNPVRKSFQESQITYVLTEGGADTLTALVGASHQAGAQVVAVRDPYPSLALALGSYYNEVGRNADAVRVLSIGLTANPNDAGLVTEKAAALIGLHRPADALATYQGGLSIPNLDPLDKARILRGEGAALTDLGKLDDAAGAYEASLRLEPGNAIALNELQYIARLKAGGASSPTQLVAPNKPKN
jgi:tetratricopeptide (TPR) repeat protein